MICFLTSAGKAFMAWGSIIGVGFCTGRGWPVRTLMIWDRSAAVKRPRKRKLPMPTASNGAAISSCPIKNKLLKKRSVKYRLRGDPNSVFGFSLCRQLPTTNQEHTASPAVPVPVLQFRFRLRVYGVRVPGIVSKSIDIGTPDIKKYRYWDARYQKVSILGRQISKSIDMGLFLLIPSLTPFPQVFLPNIFNSTCDLNYT